MRTPDLLMMSATELDRLTVLERVSERRLPQVDAAKQLGITPRHVSRLLKAFERDGARALVSKRRGRKSNPRLCGCREELGHRTDPRALRRFRSDADRGDARREARRASVARDVAAVADGRRHLEEPQAAREASSSTAAPSRLPRGARSDRRIRALLVRRPRAGMHAVGLHRRCHRPIDGAELHRIRIDLRLLPRNAAVPGAIWQAGGVLQRQALGVPGQSDRRRRPRPGRRQRLSPGPHGAVQCQVRQDGGQRQGSSPAAHGPRRPGGDPGAGRRSARSPTA